MTRDDLRDTLSIGLGTVWQRYKHYIPEGEILDQFHADIIHVVMRRLEAAGLLPEGTPTQRRALRQLRELHEAGQGGAPLRLGDDDFEALQTAIASLEGVRSDRRTGMTFGEAIEAAKAGERIQRAGWNGKDMWVAYSPGHTDLPAERFWSPPNRAHAESRGGSATVLPYLTMKTANGEIVMGWLASQTDMLADDWRVL